MVNKLKSTDRIAEIENFFKFSQEVWPELRIHHKKEISNRCSKCINSENYSTLVDGICLICRQTENNTNQNRTVAEAQNFEKQLNDIFTTYQHKGKGKYDALILFSGGKDSTFLLHKLKHSYKNLRILTVMVDNGFASSVALSNASKVLEKIDGVDHIFVKPSSSIYKKAFRYALTHLNKANEYPIVDQFDGDLTFDICRNIAASMKIPLMVAGLSRVQVQNILKLNHFESPREKEAMKRTHIDMHELASIYTEDEMSYWWDGAQWPQEQIPRVLYPFAAWEYDEYYIQKEVVRLDLIEAGNQNPLVTNNDLIPVLLAIDVVRFGYSGFEPEFAQLVREGVANRNFWINLFEAMEFQVKQGKFLSACIKDTLNRLGLTHKQLNLPVDQDIG